jgi:two-component system, NtrC family, response regulator AtoC
VIAADPPAQDLQLVVYTGTEIRKFDLPARGVVTIGRGESSTVRIDDPSVSRNHAVLHVGDALVIEDLGGPNGTMIRDRAGGRGPGETLTVRRIHGRKADLTVGDGIVLGTANVILRHAPRIEVPDLAGRERGGVVIRDPAMRTLYEQAARAARTMLSVFLLGETGAGKEVLARALHAHSPRADGPFLGIDVSTLNPSTLESELFGHERGSFTGAVATRIGLLESANGGTVFLDEALNLSLELQAKLLRVLERREVTRLGSNRPLAIDVRFVAAANGDVEAAVREGRFRQDLFFRLNGVTLTIPPLRRRPLEIEPLARLFLAAACRQVEREDVPALSNAALDLLRGHEWPGNVRELRNAVERATAFCLGDTILPEHLPPSIAEAACPRAAPVALAAQSTRPIIAPDRSSLDLMTELRAVEKARIIDALDRFGGNQSQAARDLGISRGTLIARMEEYALPRPRKREEEPAP